MNKNKSITLMIPSEKITRTYLNVLTRYLQRTMPNIPINYFVSQHDKENSVVCRTAIAESEYLKRKTGIFLGLDGDIPIKIIENFNGPKVLIYLSEIGYPVNKKKYLRGYDYFVAFDECLDNYFYDACAHENIRILSAVKDAFKEELSDQTSKSNALKELEEKYPQLIGKKIFSIITKGVCKKSYLKKYKSVEIKKILKELPDEIVLATNCPQLQSSSAGLPYKYTDKIVLFNQNDMNNMLYVSEWIISNMAITEKCNAVQRPLMYSGNSYEANAVKFRMSECMRPEQMTLESFLPIINQKRSRVCEGNGYIEFADSLNRLFE